MKMMVVFSFLNYKNIKLNAFSQITYGLLFHLGGLIFLFRDFSRLGENHYAGARRRHLAPGDSGRRGDFCFPSGGAAAQAGVAAGSAG